MEYSVIIPVYNEQDNIFPLYGEIVPVMDALKRRFEIIFVDDGSRDGTFARLQRLVSSDRRVRVIKLRRNFGQTAALDAGIRNSRGAIIITLDADLQNDPRDIPRLLAKLREGYDAVSGWRVKRSDAISKKTFSAIANKFRRWLTGERIHDAGCTLKVYKRACFAGITLYGEMHRYIPTLLLYRGFKVGELPINHRKRQYGRTKYKFGRVLNGFFDLLFIKFWNDYSARPNHFFGRLAVFQFITALLILAEQIIKAVIVQELTLGPMLVLAVLLVITGFLTFIFGFLAEIMSRMYHRERPNYEVEAVY
jgi:glycosyltransferase involved in cell wall biosynthesis